MNKNPRNYSINAVLIMLGMIGILLVLQAVVRYNDFVSNQQALMENEVEIGAREVERLINELHNEVTIFAEEKYEIINFLAAYPESEEISTHIQKKVAGLFPGYLTISISDENAFPRYSSGEKNKDTGYLDEMIELLEEEVVMCDHLLERRGRIVVEVRSRAGYCWRASYL